jgi:CO dehydrogenase/acetyl-CoA synthase epsilon subunit
MATAIESEALIPLIDGPSVPVTVVSFLIDLEWRGVEVRLEPDGTVFAGPRAAVTASDLSFLRDHRDHVVAALIYISRQERRPQ